MVENLLIGCLTMATCLSIQCVAVASMLHVLLGIDAKRAARPTLSWASTILAAVMLVLIVGNLVQIAIWAALFMAYGEFSDFSQAFYHSVVNFSTLGYGDIVLSEQRRLLGGLEATNGVLMFGLTSGFLFAVFSALTRRAVGDRVASLTSS